MAPRLLVTGASGNLGQAVLRHLLDTYAVDPRQVIATTRNPASLAAFAERGVEVRQADFAVPETLPAAFAGAERLLLISTGSLENRFAEHEAAVHAAEAAGVSFLAYTSIPDPSEKTPIFFQDHLKTERAIEASSIPNWAILRNNWYFENLSWAIPGMLKSGQWVSATGDGKAAYIGRDDLARAAAATLTGEASGRRFHTLGGQKAWGNRDIADLVGRLFGASITVVPVTPDQLRQGAIDHGVPPPVASLSAQADEVVALGQLGRITGDYEAITSQTPQSLEDWLERNRAILAG